MTTPIDLPDDVVAELKAGRKISAIKMLRAHKGIDLKSAKALVDDYVNAHPEITSLQPPNAETGIGRIVILAIGVAAIYAAYKYFF
ncbi:MAG: hypothetical protein KDI09_12290 [Halioglobus sp.]|nr:hypothetical protein [Halioglobus sp.]